MANKAGDSSDPSSIIHQLLVSCLGMWQRPHSQISVVRFCPTKSVLGETQTLERTHIQPQKLHLQRMHTHSQGRGCSCGSHASDWNTCTVVAHRLLGSESVQATRALGMHITSLRLSLPLMPTRPPSLILTPFCRLRSVTLSDCATH